jgi:phosphoserine phosphatase
MTYYFFNPLSTEDKEIFIYKLFDNIDMQRLELINEKYSKDCRIIILSASIDQYVKSFAQKIGWEGFGSYRDEQSGKFVHLHGIGKLEFLFKHFPISKYKYIYAISDSKSDLPLLENFNNYEFVGLD